MIYENMLAGSFIYSLGVVAGRNAGLKNEIINSINFYQQTPYDKKIGDLLGMWEGRSFIIEFKRDLSKVKDEFRKPARQKLLQAFEVREDFKRLSERLHFMCYGVQELEEIELHFNTYVGARDNETGSTTTFIDELLAPESAIGVKDPREMKLYLDFLLKFQDTAEADVLVTHVSSGGRPVFIRMSSYGQLALTLGQALKLEVKNELKQSNSLDHGRSGPSLGM